MKVRFGKCQNKRTEQTFMCLELWWGGWFVVDPTADPDRLSGAIWSPNVFKDYFILIDEPEAVLDDRI